jgi:hypothetical protein
MIDLKKILYCPLDLPPIPTEITMGNIESLYDYSPPNDPEVVDEWNKRGLYSLTAWKVVKLRTKPEDESQVKSRWFAQHEPGNWEWTSKAKTYTPQLIKWIEDNLPFKDIRYCTALSSVGTIKAHSDIPFNAPPELLAYHRSLEPSLYRLVLAGNIIKDGFYVSSETTPKTYTQLPEPSPGWVMGATSGLHGNDDSISNHKVLCYAMGELDQDKHYALIERSYLKYKEFAIVDN